MKSIVGYWNRVMWSAAIVRLATVLVVPAAFLTSEGRSLPFFGFVVLTNVLGIISGLILFKLRLRKPFATLLMIPHTGG